MRFQNRHQFAGEIFSNLDHAIVAQVNKIRAKTAGCIWHQIRAFNQINIVVGRCRYRFSEQLDRKSVV